MDSKDSLRRHIRREMKSWWNSAETRERASQKLANNVAEYLKNQKGTWAGFKAMTGEPSLDVALATTKVRWVYPRVENLELSFWAPKNADAFITGAFGIQEPDPTQSQRIDLADIEGFLVPGLAFDKRGARLGKGKSFYDRALKTYGGLKVGVGFAWQIQDEIPTEPWDIFMDVLVTENGIIHPHPAH